MTATRLARLIDLVLQLLVPPRRDRVAYTSHPDHIGNTYHQYRHLLWTRDGLEHVWLIGDEESRERINEDFRRMESRIPGTHRLRVVRRRSLRGYLLCLRSRWVVHSHGIYPWMRTARRGRQVVSLWHGMPLKRIGALYRTAPDRDPGPAFGTIHLATSQLFEYVIASAFAVPTHQVLRCRLPRCDALVDRHPLAPTASWIRDRLGLEPSRPLVLWLPTHRELNARAPGRRTRSFAHDLPAGTFERLDAEAARTGCTILLKPHPYDDFGDADLPRGLDHTTVIPASDWLDTGIELYDLLAIASGVVSDVSSVLFDWLATSRPYGLLGLPGASDPRGTLLPLPILRESARLHDLSTETASREFFDLVSTETPILAPPNDVVRWLHDDMDAPGSELVARTVGL